MEMILGWSFEQWAIAAGRLGRGKEISFANALKIKSRWVNENLAAPGEVQLVSENTAKDYEFAKDLFSLPFGPLHVRE